jgi:hypothetical protein
LETVENKPGVGLSRHVLLMILCCAIPLALVAAIALLHIDLGGLGYWAILLLCPLLHVLLMRGTHSRGAGQACHAQGEAPGVAASARDTAEARVSASPEQ